MPAPCACLRRTASLCAVLACCAGAPGLATAQVPAAAAEPRPAPAARAPLPDRTASTGLRDLFTDTAVDFRHLASRDSALIAAIGGIAAAAGHTADRPSSASMSGSARLDGLFGPGETIGGARTQAAAALVTYTLGRATANATATRIGADLLRAQIVTQTVTTALKGAVGRTRPDGTRYSFPSGHSSVTFASATVLQHHLGWKAGVPAYAMATYVAASRIQAKRHFLSDVTFGAAVGLIAGRTVTIGRGNQQFALAPAALPGGAGVSLTWVGRR